MEFKIEIVEDGYILTKNQYSIREQKKVYFKVKSLVKDLEKILTEIEQIKKEEE